LITEQYNTFEFHIGHCSGIHRAA